MYRTRLLLSTLVLYEYVYICTTVYPSRKGTRLARIIYNEKMGCCCFSWGQVSISSAASVCVCAACGIYVRICSRVFAHVFIPVVWVETMASPPAAGGGAIPSRIGRFECPVLLAAPTLKPHYDDGEEE